MFLKLKNNYLKKLKNEQKPKKLNEMQKKI